MLPLSIIIDVFADLEHALVQSTRELLISKGGTVLKERVSGKDTGFQYPAPPEVPEQGDPRKGSSSGLGCCCNLCEYEYRYQTCEACSAIFTKKLSYAFLGPRRITHKGGRTVLQRDASTGCPLCAQLLLFLGKEKQQKNLWNLFGLVKPDEDLFKIPFRHFNSNLCITGHGTKGYRFELTADHGTHIL
jgi:hypothetical protein